jgi:uncharacterized protein (TIGR02271 family)
MVEAPRLVTHRRGLPNTQRRQVMQSAWKDRFGIGTVVRSSDGEKLGKVAYVLEHGFGIEKGLFFPKEYFVRYEDVLEIRDDEVILAHGQDVLRAGGPQRGEETGVFERDTATTGTSAKSRIAGAAERVKDALTPGRDRDLTRDELETDEIRVPLEEEEIRATKHVEEAGQVRIRKEVVTEQKQVTIPVEREVVRVEHVPATGAATGTFEDDSITVPVREERVDVEKRPVVREELRVTKERREEQQTVGGEVRRERADVETTGTVRPETERLPGEKSTGTGGRRGR